MKKISFVITSLVRSGAERVTILLAKYYLEMGYDVEIIMLLYHDIEFDVPEGIKIVDFAGSTTSRIKRIPYWLKNLKRHFKERKPDIVVSFIARINIFTLLATNKKKTKVIVSERNDPRFDSRTFITKILINILYPKANRIVFQTEEAKKLFSKKIQKKGTVISNPITISEYASLNDFDNNLVLYAGRYSEQKDLFILLKAAEIVLKNKPEIKFELYGTGPLKNDLIDYVKRNKLSNVFINDNVPNIVEKMRKSWIFVMTSKYEGMSNSLLEASYSGVPCIITPVLGSNVIQNEVNGFVFDFGDYEKLANLIIDLKNDFNRYLDIRCNSLKKAKAIDHSEVFKKWLDIIE